MQSHCRSRSHRKVSIWAVITLRQSCRKCGCRPKNLNVALVFGLRDLFAGFRRFSQALQVLQVFAGFRRFSQLAIFATVSPSPLEPADNGQIVFAVLRSYLTLAHALVDAAETKLVTIIVFLKCHCAIDARMPSFARLSHANSLYRTCALATAAVAAMNRWAKHVYVMTWPTTVGFCPHPRPRLRQD